jgi:hypothetical protein
MIPLSVVAMRVYNPDDSPLTINGGDPAQTPTALFQIVSDYFPILNPSSGLTIQSPRLVPKMQ